MNKIQKNAEAYAKLLNTEYYYCLGYKGKGFEAHIRFSKDEFSHLDGIGQLKDIYPHSSHVIYDMALCGQISEDAIKTSKFYDEKTNLAKIDCLHLLEQAFDENEMVFRLNNKTGRTKITAELFLKTDIENNNIYVYIDRIDNRYSDFFCKSFVVNPEYDRTRDGQKMTVLWKEKIDLVSKESTVLYKYPNFNPVDLDNLADERRSVYPPISNHRRFVFGHDKMDTVPVSKEPKIERE